MNKKKSLLWFIFYAVLFSFPLTVVAAEAHLQTLDLTHHWVGFLSLGLFVVAYGLVMTEEWTDLRKSKPVILAAGIIWALIAWVYVDHGFKFRAEQALRHDFLAYAELMLLLLVVMTYINAMKERFVFDALKIWLLQKKYSYRQLFWITGLMVFFISPVADNLSTALLMSAVVIAVGSDRPKFITLACINLVVAANAGGSFSPFGDITTLMVWQSGQVDFWSFFYLFIPAFINYFIPASIMSFAVPDETPDHHQDDILLMRGAKVMVFLFILTIVTAVSFQMLLNIPAVVGMLTGLSYLQFYGYYLKRTAHLDEKFPNLSGPVGFDFFSTLSRSEWDTLLFFYGIVLCVGGLGFIGYLSWISEWVYTGWGATSANIAVGLLSGVIDNVPVMFSVLTMKPELSSGQWLLVTMTAGVGGSLLSIGSAAGVALMGQARGHYSFFSHLKWTPVIGLGYFASIYTHLWLNAELF